MKNSAILENRIFVKFENNFRKENFTLNGIANQLKKFSIDNAVNFDGIAKVTKVTKNNLTGKNLSYFLPIELINNSEYTFNQFKDCLSSMDSYLENGFKLNKNNCRMHQLRLDAKRLQTRFDNLSKSIAKLKDEYNTFELLPNNLESYKEYIKTGSQLENKKKQFKECSNYISLVENHISEIISESKK